MNTNDPGIKPSAAPKQEPAKSETSDTPVAKTDLSDCPIADGRPTEASLTHVREVHQFFAELRSKNFDFFLILLGGCAAGYVTQDEQIIKFAAAIAAAVISLIFFGLDTRAVQMIGDARSELERIEPFFNVHLHRADSWVKGKRSRLLSHRMLYTIVFVLAFITSGLAAYHRYTGLSKPPEEKAVVAPASNPPAGGAKSTAGALDDPGG